MDVRPGCMCCARLEPVYGLPRQPSSQDLLFLWTGAGVEDEGAVPVRMVGPSTTGAALGRGGLSLRGVAVCGRVQRLRMRDRARAAANG